MSSRIFGITSDLLELFTVGLPPVYPLTQQHEERENAKRLPTEKIISPAVFSSFCLFYTLSTNSRNLIATCPAVKRSWLSSNVANFASSQLLLPFYHSTVPVHRNKRRRCHLYRTRHEYLSPQVLVIKCIRMLLPCADSTDGLLCHPEPIL